MCLVTATVTNGKKVMHSCERVQNDLICLHRFFPIIKFVFKIIIFVGIYSIRTDERRNKKQKTKHVTLNNQQ